MGSTSVTVAAQHPITIETHAAQSCSGCYCNRGWCCYCRCCGPLLLLLRWLLLFLMLLLLMLLLSLLLVHPMLLLLFF